MIEEPQKWDLPVLQQEGDLQPSKGTIRLQDIHPGPRGWGANPAFLPLAAKHSEPTHQPAAQAPTTTAIVEMTADIPGNKKRG
jgi:hypothetical protein